jgi:hypothetical protein
MSATLRMWIQRLRGPVRKEQLDRELDDELRSHLEMHIEENVRRGMTAGFFAAGERSAPGKLHSSAAGFAGGSDDRVAVRVR